jgi:hypothetical protein
VVKERCNCDAELKEITNQSVDVFREIIGFLDQRIIFSRVQIQCKLQLLVDHSFNKVAMVVVAGFGFG